jgi:Glycosyltransferases involved in cell wall biogenesis
LNPIFSIITVTYNASHVLERTIQSILSQTYEDIEYIVIDGNSTDGTQDIIRKYDFQIQCWISEPDESLYDAMNKGLAKANGDYVWFINAGDEIYSPQTVSQIVSGLNEKSPDIIYGETQIIDKNGKPLGMRRLRAPEKLNWKSFKMGMLVCHQSFIVRREIALPFNLSYHYSSDFDWCIRCMRKTNSIINSGLILSRFMEAGVTSENRKASLKERYRVMCRHYGKFSTRMRHLWFALRFMINRKQ